MDISAPAKKKFPWKIVIIVLLVIGVTIATVVIVRKKKKASMIEDLIKAGTSVQEDVLKSMSYSDVKVLWESAKTNAGT